MKAACIGRNYPDHAKELGNQVPDEPVFFLKPASAFVPTGSPIRLPSFSQEVQYEAELVLRIGAGSPGTALPGLEAFTIGLDLTARDVQNELKMKGLPWEKAKAWDGSAVLGEWLPLAGRDPDDLAFDLTINDGLVQSGSTAEMIFSVQELLAHVTRYITLGPGDVLFTGTPQGVGRLEHGDRIQGRCDGEVVLLTSVTQV
ncbi:MAG: fumarylacetoacetate hydrolase family protein [Flavobacteriales bacterium]|nr:fumarylacetoacetate hydrolase family protein [Flavobacteriales bacterium]